MADPVTVVVVPGTTNATWRGALLGYHGVAVARGWRTVFLSNDPALEANLRRVRPQGLLLGSENIKLKLVRQTPAVCVDLAADYEAYPGLPLVRIDDDLIGREAAQHFIDLGLRSLATLCLHLPRYPETFSTRRARAFRAAAGQRTCAEWQNAIWRIASPGDDPGPFTRWLAALPKPLGLFAGCDHWGINPMRAANGYRDQFFRAEFAVGTPRLLWGANCDNQGFYGPDCCGIVQVTVEIPPKGTQRVDYLLGNAADVAEVKALRARVTPELLDQWCAEQMSIESANAQKFRVNTGPQNAHRDALMNLFVKKQMYSYLIDKSGFRDNLQTDAGIALFDYPTARANILRALTSQSPDGKVLHSFRPLNRKQYADKPAWILHAIPWLIKESGDFDLLKVDVPYFESADHGTVWDHIQRTVRYLAHDTGKRGICRQHFADWNDGLEPSPETGERESVMVTQQFCFGLREVAELADQINDSAFAAECRKTYAHFKDRLNSVAWDGRWYTRTICEDGYALGSGNNKEARIFLNTQSWAVLSGIADGERAKLCMQAVDELCTKDIGYVINDPPLTEYDPRIGRFSTIVPGHATNGGAYCHAAGFKAVADCLLGRADRAWETYLKVIPDSPSNPLTRSRAEPFSFQNMYESVPEIYGLAGYAWRTGTAPWFAMTLVEWILGARRHYDGLLIDPCLTAAIPHATLTRTFRGSTYHITLDNTAGNCTGARSITLDGTPIKGNVIRVTPGTHQVKVTI